MRLIFLFITALWPAMALAQNTSASGERLFDLHCAACHGADARGTGIVGATLEETPADLTTLTKRNGGPFPVSLTVTKIDGRTRVRAHGREMPVYGYFFKGPKETLQTPEGESIDTTIAIAQIIAWLRTIQR